MKWTFYHQLHFNSSVCSKICRFLNSLLHNHIKGLVSSVAVLSLLCEINCNIKGVIFAILHLVSITGSTCVRVRIYSVCYGMQNSLWMKSYRMQNSIDVKGSTEEVLHYFRDAKWHIRLFLSHNWKLRSFEDTKSQTDVNGVVCPPWKTPASLLRSQWISLVLGMTVMTSFGMQNGAKKRDTPH